MEKIYSKHFKGTNKIYMLIKLERECLYLVSYDITKDTVVIRTKINGKYETAKLEEKVEKEVSSRIIGHLLTESNELIKTIITS